MAARRASAIAFAPHYAVPQALDQSGIDALIHAFAAGAQRALTLVLTSLKSTPLTATCL